MFTLSDCKDKGVRTYEIVAKNKFFFMASNSKGLPSADTLKNTFNLNTKNDINFENPVFNKFAILTS